MKSQEFSDAVERALVHLYHGECRPHRARYVVKEGEYPSGLSGYTYTTVFPFVEVNQPGGAAVSPHILTGHGRILVMELDPRRERDGTVSLQLFTRPIENETHQLRRLSPEAFLRADFVELSWFGMSNLSNVSPVPAFAGGPGAGSGARLFVTYDAGRPAEISPQTLDFMSPVGRSCEYRCSIDGVVSPLILTTGHPVYDPDFDAKGRGRLLLTNMVMRISSLLHLNRAARADLYVLTWDGEGPLTSPLRVRVGGKPVVLEQSSTHQLCITRDYLVIIETSLSLGPSSVLRPLLPAIFGGSAAGDEPPSIKGSIEGALSLWLKPPAQAASTNLYLIAKSELRRAIAEGAEDIEATSVTVDWEMTHAVADHDDPEGVITLYCQHNIGADPTRHVGSGAPRVGEGRIPAELSGMFSAATDLNQVRKYEIDAQHGAVLSVRAFPDPDGDDFAFGLNLLPPLQILPYRGEGDPLLAAVQRWKYTYWVAAGWSSCTMAEGVFEMYQRAREGGDEGPRRLVPLDEFRRRIEDVSHGVIFYRLDRELRVESAYRFAPGVLMAAPIFVPRPGGREVDEGYIVGQVWSHLDVHMEIWIWDASRPLDEGPVCKLGPSWPEEGMRPGFPLHSAWMDTPAVERWQPAEYTAPAIDLGTTFKAGQILSLGGTAARRLIEEVFSR